MNTQLLHFLIMSVVLCYVTALIILIISKNLGKTSGILAVVFHVLIAGIVLYRVWVHEPTSFSNALWFSAFICSGILGFAFIFRQKFWLLLKIYFSLFILSLPLFLVSPSRVFTVMSLGLLSTDNMNELHLQDSYYLLRERGMIEHEASKSTYKVVKRLGFFNKTLARDLQFHFIPDSAIVLFLDEKSEIRIRAFHQNPTGLDSMDIKAITIAGRDTLLRIGKSH